MLTDSTLNSFSPLLQKWYEEHKRDLPWRNTKKPYEIWLSEIILQQTRVAQGLDYYLRFVNRFPNISDLANAHEDEVLKLWQGLGYYSRARNIHFTAKHIQNTYNGIFPDSYEEIIKLKGIGEYTASAICSFAYNQPYAVVDGNVYRVLSRFLGIDTPIDSSNGKKEFAASAQELLDKKNPCNHNQAIMEFGALQCTPTNPDCAVCPLNRYCVAYKGNLTALLPVKSKQTKQRDRFFHYFCFVYNDQTFIQKRTENDVWKNLYEFPLIETESDMDFESLIQTSAYKNMISGIDHIELISPPFTTKHVLSHQKIATKFYTLRIFSSPKNINKYVLINFNRLSNYPISRLTELFLEKFEPDF